MNYPKDVLDLFDSPKHIGFSTNDKDVIIGETGDGLNGDFVKVYFKIDNNKDIIFGKYNARGCPYLIACCEKVFDTLVNKNIKDLDCIDYKQIAKDLSLPYIKLYCIIQVETAIKNVLT